MSKTNAIGNSHTETCREKQHICSPLSFVLSSRLAFARIIMAGVNRFADRSVAAYTTAQLLFKLTNAVVTERGAKMSEWLTLRDGECVRKLPACCDKTFLIWLCVQASPWVRTVCACECVQPSDNSSLSLPPMTADYRCCLWRCTWEATHTCPGLVSGLKLIYRLHVCSLVLLVLRRLLISMSFNVFTLVNQLVRML